MESLLVKGNSKDDIKLLATLAQKMGLKVEFINEGYTTVNEPDTEWERLTNEQQQGLLQGLAEADADLTEDMDDVLREFRERYE